MKRVLLIGLVSALALGACENTGAGPTGGFSDPPPDINAVDPRPEKLDGSSSQEFEADDLTRAESASEAVQDYCAGAVSEAQEVGCLSHVDKSDIPNLSGTSNVPAWATPPSVPAWAK